MKHIYRYAHQAAEENGLYEHHFYLSDSPILVDGSPRNAKTIQFSLYSERPEIDLDTATTMKIQYWRPWGFTGDPRGTVAQRNLDFNTHLTANERHLRKGMAAFSATAQLDGTFNFRLADAADPRRLFYLDVTLPITEILSINDPAILPDLTESITNSVVTDGDTLPLNFAYIRRLSPEGQPYDVIHLYLTEVELSSDLQAPEAMLFYIRVARGEELTSRTVQQNFYFWNSELSNENAILIDSFAAADIPASPHIGNTPIHLDYTKGVRGAVNIQPSEGAIELRWRHQYFSGTYSGPLVELD